MAPRVLGDATRSFCERKQTKLVLNNVSLESVESIYLSVFLNNTLIASLWFTMEESIKPRVTVQFITSLTPFFAQDN